MLIYHIQEIMSAINASYSIKKAKETIPSAFTLYAVMLVQVKYKSSPLGN